MAEFRVSNLVTLVDLLLFGDSFHRRDANSLHFKNVFVPRMDQVINFGIPHVGELIFENIDTPGLLQCRAVSETWKALADNVLLKRYKSNGKIIEACETGLTEIVKILLDRLENVLTELDAKDNNGRTAFMLACQNGHTDIVKLVLDYFDSKTVVVDDNEQNRRAALLLAWRNGQINDIQYLIRRYESAHYRPDYTQIHLMNVDQNGRKAFLLACQYGHIDVVKILHNAEPKDVQVVLNVLDFQDTYRKQTAFMLACQNGHIDVVKFLLEALDYKQVNAKDNSDNTAFMWACGNGHDDVVKLILDNSERKQIELNTTNCQRRTAFMLACKYGHKKVVKLLLAHSSDSKNIELNVEDRHGQTAFMLACYNGQIEVVKLCLDYSEVLDVNVPKTNQLTQPIKDLFLLKKVRN